MMRHTLLAAMVLMAGAAPSFAQTTEPSLAALDREIQQLYRDMQSRTVRVTVPIHLPTRLLEQEHPLSKWAPQLDPKILQQLQEAKARGETRVFVAQQATTQQSTQPAPLNPNDAPLPLPQETAVVNAEFTGLVLDQRGDVLVPLYIDSAPPYLEGPLQVIVDDHRATTAFVVAADQPTRLSVIRMADPTGLLPAKFSKSKPELGALVLMLNPTRRAAKLGVWTGTADENAILLTTAGEVAGIVRNNHALFPSMFVPVVEQLMSGQRVKRATLGVVIREVGSDDPDRTRIPALGSRPAAQVDQVFENSAAARAGIMPGDIILSLGNEAVEDVATFAAAIASYRGQTPLRIIRAGRERTLSVDLQVQ